MLECMKSVEGRKSRNSQDKSTSTIYGSWFTSRVVDQAHDLGVKELRILLSVSEVYELGL